MARIDRILLPRSASASCRSLVKLLDGDVFESELALLRVACLKTSLRFRSSHETRLLAQMCRSLNEVKAASASQISGLFEALEISSSKNKVETAISLLETLEKTCTSTNKCLKLILWSFGETIRWLRVGHLAPHLLTLVSVLSRLRFILKAIIVHSNELFKDIYSATRIMSKDKLIKEVCRIELELLKLKN